VKVPAIAHPFLRAVESVHRRQGLVGGATSGVKGRKSVVGWATTRNTDKVVF